MFFFQIPWMPEALLRINRFWALGRMVQASGRRGNFSDEDLALYRQAWAQPGALTGMLNWYRALFQRRARQSNQSAVRVHVPTMILWGAQDPTMGREMAEESAKLCDDVSLLFFERAGHWIQRDEAEQVNRRILQFLHDE